MEKSLPHLIIIILLLEFIMFFAIATHDDKKDCEEMGLDFYGSIRAKKYNVDYGCYENGLKISHTDRYDDLRAQYMQNKLNKK